MSVYWRWNTSQRKNKRTNCCCCLVVEPPGFLLRKIRLSLSTRQSPKLNEEMNVGILEDDEKTVLWVNSPRSHWVFWCIGEWNIVRAKKTAIKKTPNKASKRSKQYKRMASTGSYWFLSIFPLFPLLSERRPNDRILMGVFAPTEKIMIFQRLSTKPRR